MEQGLISEQPQGQSGEPSRAERWKGQTFYKKGFSCDFEVVTALCDFFCD